MQKVLPGPGLVQQASMKAPPKRKGNTGISKSKLSRSVPQ